MANKSNSITLTEIIKHLYIDAEGKFRRKISRFRNRVGELAGGFDSKGYEVIRINSVKYRAHRLYYMIYHDLEILDDEVYIDHVNGIVSDNRKENLRIANHRQNIRNSKVDCRNTSGSTGVYWHKRDKRWTASIGFDGKLHNLGYFLDKAEAESAYKIASINLHGDFSKIKRNLLVDASATVKYFNS